MCTQVPECYTHSLLPSRPEAGRLSSGTGVAEAAALCLGSSWVKGQSSRGLRAVTGLVSVPAAADYGVVGMGDTGEFAAWDRS